MIKMGTRDVTHGAADIQELDLIDEYVKENTAKEQESQPRKLPGPPPPPQELEDLNPVARSQHMHPMLVARGTAPQVPLPHLTVATSSMASPHSNMAGHQRPIRHTRGGQGAVSGMGLRVAQQEQSGTDLLEQFLEKPVLEIVEQPKERGMRFRYECEGRSAGSILGASSTESNKTLPTIEIKGCKPKMKKIKVTVSLVTKDIPHRPHPHSLVGKDCADGICVIRLNSCRSCRHSFSNLGIQCVRRKELEVALEKRRSQKIDPFNTGHSKSIEDIDMNVVRLCFQCEVETENEERILLSPVVSSAIYDKKATTTSELKINRLNVVRGPCTGKTEIYLLCDKVQKDDIDIIFSVGKWEAKAEFAQTDVHRQIAIVFKSPPYREQDIREEVDVNVFLRRLSDHMDSEPVKFTYEPQNRDPYGVNRKRKHGSDMKFGERCSVAAQSVTLPESLSPLPFASPSFVPSDATQAEVVTPHLAHVMGEIHHPSTSQDVKQEDNFYHSLEMSSAEFQVILAGISQVLEGSAATGLSPLVDVGFPEQVPLQGYGHPNVSLPTTFNQDPNSNYPLAGMDFNCNMTEESRMQPDMNFYNDVHFHYPSQMVNGAQPHLHALSFDLLLEDPDGPTPQPLRPCETEDPALGPPVKTESHIDL